ncbi:hypothetical protein HKD37_01G001271 [Glycine soja]
MGRPLEGRKPYLFSRFYPSMARVAKVVKISAQELDRVKTNRNGVVGLPRKSLEEKAKALADQGEWTSFIDILALLVFETILFPNVDRLMGLVAINAFLAYHHSKESPIVAILADAYDTFDLRCEKSSTRIICCTPALYGFVTFRKGMCKILKRRAKRWPLGKGNQPPLDLRNQYDEFCWELERTRWHKALTRQPDGRIDVALVKDFYANLFDPEDKSPRQVRVRRKLIKFDREKLNAFLETSVVLEPRERYSTYSRFCHSQPDPQELVVRLCIPGRGFVLNVEGAPWKLQRKDLTTLVQT